MEFIGNINDSDIEAIAQDVVENYDFTYTIEAILDYDEIARYVEDNINVGGAVEDVVMDQRLVDEDEVQRLIDTALSHENDDVEILGNRIRDLAARVETLENALRALADVMKPNQTTVTHGGSGFQTGRLLNGDVQSFGYPIVGGF